jgi:AraC-like DNA-binding protein
MVAQVSGCPVELEIKGHRPVPVADGEGMLIGTGIQHSIQFVGTGQAVSRFAHIRVNIMGGIDLFRLFGVPHVTSPELGEMVGATCARLAALHGSVAAPSLNRILKVRALTELLVNDIFEQIPANAAALEVVPRILRVLPCIDHIRAHLGEDITCGALASLASLSLTRFHEVFKGALGVSPMEFVTQERLRAAQDLLLSTALPIGEIAQRVGFRDPFHFTRQFHARNGVSPSGYRKQIRESVAGVSDGPGGG